MNNATTSCANCANDFAVTDDDWIFYQSMNVSPPTWCPDCRLQRRMAFTNERTLYSSTCGLCGKSMITIYHPSSPFPVYCKSCWWSDQWDASDFARDYDFSRPFFEQFAELKNAVPRCDLVQSGEMIQSEYCNRATNNKKCYLCFRSTNNEDCLYSHQIVDSRDCMECLNIQKSERCYECVDCVGCYNVLFSRESQNCTDSAFLVDCRGCFNCFGCVNLRNKEYHIYNEPYSPDAYRAKITELFPRTSSAIAGLIEKIGDHSLNYVRPYITSIRSEDVSGNWIYDSTNVKNSYICRGVENGKYLYQVTDAKDCMDYFHFGRGSERIYETANCGLNCSNIKMSNEIFVNNSSLSYCDWCFSSSNCFGCVGLKKGSWQILNKKYSEEEYNRLVDQIKTHMNDRPYRDGQGRVFRYGEFFPPELSPMCYNETVAQAYFPLSKEEALSQGHRWRDQETKGIAVTKPASTLPEAIGNVDDTILKDIIGCVHDGTCREQCTVGYRIVRKELEFYRSMNLPLPRLCPNCRHHQRTAQQPSIFLHQRPCACAGAQSQNGAYKNTAPHSHGETPCTNQFETVYAPERPEIVYCEECYCAEIV